MVSAKTPSSQSGKSPSIDLTSNSLDENTIHSTPSKTLDTYSTALDIPFTSSEPAISIPQFSKNTENFIFSDEIIDKTLTNDDASSSNIHNQVCENSDVAFLFPRPPTAENADESINPLKRKRIENPIPTLETRSIHTQTERIEMTSSSTSPLRLSNDSSAHPGEDINMSSDSIISLPNSPSMIIVTKSSEDQSLKMAREYFGGTPYAGQQKIVAEDYPSPEQMKLLVAQDPKKAANFIFNYNKKVKPQNFVRRIHSLRHDFPKDGIHLIPRNGGIGATDIEERVARGKYNSTTKMINDHSSKSFATVVAKSKVGKIRKDNAKYLAFGDDDTDLKEKHQEKLLARLSKSARVNTSAKPFFHNKRANRWISNNRIPNKMKNDFFKLRYNVMPTRSSTKFFNGGKTRCRGCGGPSETVKHLISKCPANHGLITLRHNEVVKQLIALGPRNPRARIYQEKVFKTIDGNIKPDIILVDGNIAKVFEVAVPFEENDSTLLSTYQVKLNKYKKHKEVIREKLQVDSVIFEPLILGAMGDILEKSANAIVQHFKVNKYAIADLSQAMLRKSRNMVYNITHRKNG
ncbi:hypothetical protein SNEBB_000499 [Seison nebaliae]|nr:hypothetical protein SNEBB_000499 [Seison nebaliae]